VADDPEPSPPAPSRGATRLRLAAACALLVALAFQQVPGFTVPDTKLDLTQDPLAFLGRALNLWEPSVALGQVQNQAYGYLFPMGPFFAAADAVGLPGWVAGRLWWAVLLVVGFLGTVRLLRALGVGSDLVQVLAGFAYVTAPRTLTVLGPISSEALPVVLLPWMLLPLVRGTRGETTPLRAAALSACAVLLMGGVNATATVAVVPVGLVWLLVMARGRLRVALLGWWAVFGALATAWWLVPLLLLGRYSFPFLDYVESAAATTLNSSAGEVLRGSTHWVGYVPVGGSSWVAGSLVATNPVLVVLGALVAAVGLAGLVDRGGPGRAPLPGRRALAVSLLLGVAVMVAGWVGPLSSPTAPWVRDLLDGPLAPLRNVHKLDAMVRLPLVVGLAHALSRLEVPRASGWTRARVRVVAVLVVGAAASPLLAGQVAPRGAFVEVPPYWRDAAAYLDDHSRGGTTLLLPGEGFGRFLWGRTVDEPVQTLMRTPWVTRQQAGPLAGTGTVRVLDAVEEAVAQGQPVEGLADLLASAGIDQVLLRNDLDWAGTGGPRPAVVHRALASSPGLTRVATFGVVSPGSREDFLVVDDGLQATLPTLEVFRVDRDVQRVTAPLVGDLVSVGGDADTVLGLEAMGRLSGQPVVLEGDTGAANLTPARVVASDTVRRRVMSFGGLRGNASHTLAADEAVDPPGVAADLRSLPDEIETVAVLDGLRSVTASSSASTPSALIDRNQLRHPFSAVDGRTGTVWSSGTTTPGGGRQWWRADLERPRDPSGTEVRLGASAVARERLTALTVVTEQGSITTTIPPDVTTFTPTVPSGPTRWIELRAESFGGSPVVRGSFALSEVRIPGVRASRTLAVPVGSTGSGVVDGVLLSASTGHRPGCVDLGARVVCTPLVARSDEEDGRVDRTLVGTSSADGTAGITLEASLTLAGAERLGLAGGASVSSTWVDEPGGSALALVDRDPATSWRPAASDREPTVDLAWGVDRAVASVRLVLDRGGAGSEPTRVRVRGGGAERVAELREVDRTGSSVTVEASFEPLTAAAVELGFPDVAVVASQRVVGAGVTRMPIGIAEVELPDAADVLATAPDGRVEVGCEDGVAVRLDGRSVPVRGSVGVREVAGGQPVRWRACGPDGADRVAWSPGTHRLRSGDDLLVRHAYVDLAGADGSAGATPAGSRTVRTVEWEPQHRRVEIGRGAAALVVVAENFNAGWEARTDDGRLLVPVRVEGWKQAWLLPEGGATEVELTYVPATTYRWGLLGGGAAALLLVLVVLLGALRRRPARPTQELPPEPTGRRGALARLAGLVGLVVVGGPAALLALGALATASRRLTARLPLVAAGALVAAGLVTASARLWTWPWTTLPTALAHVLGVLAVAVVVLSLGPARRAAGPVPPPAGAPARTARASRAG
jgi:arabinofuranan 3-O-arabinosyltransferase